MPAPFTAECRFLTPLFLPSQIEICYSEPLAYTVSDDCHVRLPAHGIGFEVRNKKSRKPHLSGIIRPGLQVGSVDVDVPKSSNM